MHSVRRLGGVLGRLSLVAAVTVPFIMGAMTTTAGASEAAPILVSSSALLADAPSDLGTSGAAVVGTARYPVPANAVYVAPNGSDSNAGTSTAPLKTVQTAVGRAPAGGTVVLRAGTYHQSVSIVSRTVTIQNYPGEAVWFDGSSVVTNFRASGSAWVLESWTSRFDASASYSFGGSDGNTPGWTFVNPAHPMASHPDQVWIDSIAQAQVGSLSQVRPGTFFVDYAARRLYIGSNPSGHTVRSSDIAKAISIRTPNSVLRGVGIRRYAPSIPHIGAVTAEQPGIILENNVFSDNATTGLGIIAKDITANKLTVERNGLLGIHVATADNVKLLNVRSTGNNTEHFNTAPVSGGMKIGRSRGVTIDHGTFGSNEGPGIWLDVSVYNTTITNSVVTGNANHGLFLEISAKVVVANNLISRNGANGIKLNNTSDVSIWNNTFIDNGRPLWIVQDARRGSNPRDYGHDLRQPQPDPTMTWINGPVIVRNNVFSGATILNGLMAVEDYSREFTAEQMRVSAQGDVYQRDSAGRPAATVIWARGAQPAALYTTLAAFKGATGQESRGIALDGSEAVLADGSLTSSVANVQSTVAEPLPSQIANLMRQPVGTRRIGAIITRSNLAPSAAFSAAVKNLQVTVDGTKSIDPDGTVTTYQWNFGDGTTASGASATHSYRAAGTYQVALTVADNRAATARVVHSVTVVAATELASDTFGRTVAGGFGTASVGGAWTVKGTAQNYWTDGQVGRMRLAAPGSSLAASLPRVSGADVDITVSFALDKIPTNKGTYLSLDGRHQADSSTYRAKVIVSGNGALVLQLFRVSGVGAETALTSVAVPGMTYKPGNLIRLRFQIVGANLRAKLYPATTAEPANWVTSATDTAITAPGSIGLIATLSSTVTNAPVVVTVDNLVAMRAQR
jgi:parallel beta-helix repeat protein